ncbi:MAG TPA: YbaK/EbsC family protein [Longilinea sp.]|nr:YbaK/EbsC family protein [Longilinea sp.]
MSNNLSPSAQRVQLAIQELDLHCEVIELSGSTRTALEAAEAVGCDLGQIVKSLVFASVSSHQPILALVSGANRVNEQRLSAVFGEPVMKADGDFVRAQTGFAIGGVPPLGHTYQMKTFIDSDLMAFDRIWAAAGTPHALFSLTPAELLVMTHGEVANIS